MGKFASSSGFHRPRLFFGSVWNSITGPWRTVWEIVDPTSVGDIFGLAWCAIPTTIASIFTGIFGIFDGLYRAVKRSNISKAKAKQINDKLNNLTNKQTIDICNKIRTRSFDKIGSNSSVKLYNEITKYSDNNYKIEDKKTAIMEYMFSKNRFGVYKNRGKQMEKDIINVLDDVNPHIRCK